MKNLITVLFLMSVSSAFADEKLLCNVKMTNQTLLLEKGKALSVSDEERELGIDRKWDYKAYLQTTELPFAEIYQGVGTEADVEFGFTSSDGRLSVQLFMDDMAGSLTLDGQDLKVSNCKTL